jgi:hypothetical protein
MKPASTKVPDELADRIDEYADRHNLTRSKAIRDLTEAGLEAEETPDHVSLPTVIAGIGLFFFLGAYAEVSIEPFAGNVGGLLVLVALLIQYRPIVDYLRHLAGRVRSSPS